jgi:hypothetical protein
MTFPQISYWKFPKLRELRERRLDNKEGKEGKKERRIHIHQGRGLVELHLLSLIVPSEQKRMLGSEKASVLGSCVALKGMK